MDRPFLFMSGEFGVSMPLAFKRDHWQHTMSPSELVVVEEGGRRYVRRGMLPVERLRGLIFYADMGDKALELRNIELLSAYKIPCWPTPGTLSRMYDRHIVLRSLGIEGLITHPTVVTEQPICDALPYPFVLKEGLTHRGVGKHLIRGPEDWPTQIEPGLCTIEPYFEGTSIRVLKIEQKLFGIRVDNETSWIKNTAGAEATRFGWTNATHNLRRHARAVSDYLNLEVVGMDYIIEPNGEFHFLEANCFPGLNVDDEVAQAATEFLSERMDEIERIARV